ncbi:hypothetical protein IWW36_000803 [Coemansia brasiliensis]|uniref:Uncharacterized protein n=1 Tax=Coemansia brasiliensis TaxID=2650707 RepID=A0A9W8IA84_9FUNG|nr:hypothetical protein IWW36_000803 [Coemansia brasiliensis]
MFGNRISLISKSLIRYVGTLNDVNEKEETISLEQVRSMGTEGRRGNPLEEIPPLNNIYEFIQFRASDVLSVEFENEMQAPPKPQIPNDPAILEARTQPAAPAYAPQVHSTAPVEPNLGAAAVNKGTAPAQARVPPVAATAVPQQQQHIQAATGHVIEADTSDNQQINQRRQGGHAPRGGYTPRGRGGYNNGRGTGARRGNYQGGRGGYQNRHGRVEVPESDFDFESSNSKLNKDDLAKEFAQMNIQVVGGEGATEGDGPNASSTSSATSPVATAPSAAYQPKSSFFDNISCETKERMEMREQGMSHEERRSRVQAERQQNYETFGQVVAEQNRYRYNNRYNGGRGGQHHSNWRGGGRGGRGYHRGGYNPNYRGNNYRSQGSSRGYYSQQQSQPQQNRNESSNAATATTESSVAA